MGWVEGKPKIFRKIMDGEHMTPGNILIVRHLPSSLDASEKEDLLKHFGAVSVKCMANHGRMVSDQTRLI